MAFSNSYFNFWWMALVFMGKLANLAFVKLCFVAGLFLYHLSLHRIFMQQAKGIFKYSSQQLRMWNELATLFLFIIVALAVIKQIPDVVWGLTFIIAFAIVLMIAIKLYKKFRKG